MATDTLAAGEVELTVPVSGFDIPASMLFGHRTRLLDCWTPEIEQIVRPEMKVDAGVVTLRVVQGFTSDFMKPMRTRNPWTLLRQRGRISHGDNYIYDARHETDGNIAHQLHNIAPFVLLAKRELKAALGRDVEIHVVLRSSPAHFTLELYRMLGIPVIETDASVEGRIILVDSKPIDTHVDGRIMGGGHPSDALLPDVYEAYRDPAGCGGSPEKLFVSRKGSRSITNEVEISGMLEARGFKTVYFQGIPVVEQRRLFGNAREIVGIHGAALAFLAFNGNGLARPRGDRGGLRLIEIFPAGYSVSMYRRHAASMNAHWCAVRGQITSEIVRDVDERGLARSHENAPFRLDPLSLEKALEYAHGAPVAISPSLESGRPRA